MHLHFLSIVTVVILATAASESIRLNFVKGVNTNEFTDYYFSCNVMGRFIQWHYNNEPLTGFHINDEIGASKVLGKANYIYTAMLLSSEPLTTHNRTMASIILVSFILCIDRTILTITSIFIMTGNSEVQVTCSYEGNERRVHSNLEYETQNTVPVEGVTDSTFVATNVQTNSTTKNNRMSTNKDDVVMNSSDTANKQTIFVTVATLFLYIIIQIIPSL